MSSKADLINTLPEEVLVEVFDFLDSDSRKNAELTCRRWYEIISVDIRFAKYHAISLDNCILQFNQPPVTEIMASQRKIGQVFVGEVRYSGDLSSFWNHLGRTVVELSLKEFSPYSMRSYFLADIIAKFTRLERLRFGKYHMEREMMRTSSSTYTCKWPSVKHLVIDSLRLEPENYDFFNTIMPNLQTIEIGMYEGCDDEFMNKYLAKLRMLGVSTKYLGVFLLSRIARLDDCNLLKIACIADSTSHLDALVETIEFQPSVAEVDLSFISFPRISIPCLKKLRLEFNEPVTSFEPLAQFQHLKELEMKLSNYDSKCFFGHEVVHLSSLESFSIYSFASGHCSTCHKFMFQSFPNLKTFTYESCFVTSVDTLAMITKHLKHIERLTLKYFVTESLKLDGFLLEWTKMPKLKRLEMRAFGNVSKDGLTNLCKKCPNLEFLSFSGASNFNDKFLDLLATKLKKARIIKVEQRKQPHEVLKRNITYSVEDDANGRRTHCYRL